MLCNIPLQFSIISVEYPELPDPDVPSNVDLCCHSQHVFVLFKKRFDDILQIRLYLLLCPSQYLAGSMVFCRSSRLRLNAGSAAISSRRLLS